MLLRPDDIVISAPVKSGTTWLQTICALLIFQRPELPATLRELSPWLDSKFRPIDEVVAELAAQPHRRFVKTHTPVDGLPRGVCVLAGARHPLDAAISFYHQFRNIEHPRRDPAPRENEHDWLGRWIDDDPDPLVHTESLPGVLRMVQLAWDDPDVLLVHYADLSTDLEGQMRGIAERLAIGIPESLWPVLVEAASFERMADRADVLVPRARFKDNRAFFRGGRSGDGARVLTPAELDRYHRRVAALTSPEVAAWIHR